MGTSSENVLSLEYQHTTADAGKRKEAGEQTVGAPEHANAESDAQPQDKTGGCKTVPRTLFSATLLLNAVLLEVALTSLSLCFWLRQQLHNTCGFGEG